MRLANGLISAYIPCIPTHVYTIFGGHACADADVIMFVIIVALLARVAIKS